MFESECDLKMHVKILKIWVSKLISWPIKQLAKNSLVLNQEWYNHDDITNRSTVMGR